MGPDAFAPRGQPLDDRSPDHEGTDRTPEPSQQWIGEHDQGPPPGPEQNQYRIVSTGLWSEPEHEIGADEQPADQAIKQDGPQRFGAHPLAQLRFPPPEVKA